MTEHVCEWNFCAMDEWAWCECGKTLNFQKIESCLNENETLKVDKRLLMHVVHGRAMASSLPKHLKEE